MSNYIPYPFFYDDVPIDISFIFRDERPAGKHGFLSVCGRDFVFEDGKKATFWGANFNGAACLPTHEYSEMIAKRLSKIGINLVRMHQLDAEYHTRNLFSASKGERSTGAKINPDSIDRLDYLIYCLKKEGIYTYIDTFTYRKFRSDEGVASAHLLQNAAKPYCCFNRRLIDLQKELAEELWTHENPYTGLRYCDEPAIVMVEIANECDLFCNNESFEYVRAV